MILQDEYRLVHPSCCGVPFAMNEMVCRARMRDRKNWWCPNCGSCRHFTGESDEQRKLREAERRAAREQDRRIAAEERADEKTRMYKRMRARIQHGVCPDCNRTFDNLARHMATKHPEMDNAHKLKHLRLQFGLTQRGLAAEAFGDPTKASYISAYENQRNVPAQARDRLEEWLEGEH